MFLLLMLLNEANAKLVETFNLLDDYNYIQKHVSLDFLKQEEGFSLKGYVPMSNNQPIGKSGVTVLTGFDLGQHNEFDLKNIGIYEYHRILKPYLGLKRFQAVNYLSDHPLELDAVIGHKIDLKTKVFYFNKFIKEIATTKLTLQDLTYNQKTALFSIFYNYGHIPKPVKIPLKAKKWTNVGESIKNLNSNKSRRLRESNLFLTAK